MKCGPTYHFFLVERMAPCAYCVFHVPARRVIKVVPIVAFSTTSNDLHVKQFHVLVVDDHVISQIRLNTESERYSACACSLP